MGRQNPVRKRGRSAWKPLQIERQKTQIAKAVRSALTELAGETVRTVAGHQWFSYDGGKTWTGSRRVLAPIEERRGR